jgi:hypothetical protein
MVSRNSAPFYLYKPRSSATGTVMVQIGHKNCAAPVTTTASSTNVVNKLA